MLILMIFPAEWTGISKKHSCRSSCIIVTTIFVWLILTATVILIPVHHWLLVIITASCPITVITRIFIRRCLTSPIQGILSAGTRNLFWTMATQQRYHLQHLIHRDHSERDKHKRWNIQTNHVIWSTGIDFLMFRRDSDAIHSQNDDHLLINFFMRTETISLFFKEYSRIGK